MTEPPRKRRPYRGADKGPRSLSDVMDDVLATVVPPTGGTKAGGARADGSPTGAAAPSPSALGAVFTKWEEIVGPGVAAHARPLRLSGGTLVVAVDQPAWATQVRALGEEFRRRVGEVTGSPPDTVRVVVRPFEDGPSKRP